MSHTEQIVVSAYTREEVERVPLRSAADAERMLQRATQLHKDFDGRLPVWQRLEILGRLADLMEQQHDALARLIATEGGKPLTDARIEATRAIDGVRTTASTLHHLGGREVPMGLTQATENRLAFTIREPIGPVLAISAFNHPLNLIVHQVVPAIAVGCPVIVKPAEPVPLCCLKFAELVAEAGLPEGWLQVCVCEVDVASKLVADPRIQFLTFIGSARVGWMLRQQMAAGGRCALEHGGAAPVIVLDDADVSSIVPPLTKGGYYHAGQVCVSVQRVYASPGRAEELAQALAQAASDLSVGDPLLAETEVGPLIRPQEVVRVGEWIDEAVKGGGKLLCGGKRLSETCYAPTVVLDPPADCRLAQAEVFGPAVAVFSCDRRAAIEAANGLDVAFQAAVFGKDMDVLMDTARRLDASAVMLNDHTAFRADWMPFAGRRSSGLGVGGMEATMEEMTAEKMMVLHLSA